MLQTNTVKCDQWSYRKPARIDNSKLRHRQTTLETPNFFAKFREYRHESSTAKFEDF